MKKIILFLFFIISGTAFFLMAVSQQNANADTDTAKSINYLNQIPPGKTAAVFAPDIVSTGLFEMNAAFNPTFDRFYYSIADPYQNFNSIVLIRKDKDIWTSSEVASFSGKYSDFDPVFSPDGKKLFFISRRPIEPNGEQKADSDIWMIDFIKSDGSEPVRLPSTVNSDSDEYYASLSAKGNLYFTSTRDGGKGAWDIYKVTMNGDTFEDLENLSDGVNSKYNEHDPFIAPDESYIIFTSNRPGGFGRGDLYISISKPDGSWSQAKNLGKEINSQDYEYCPVVSPDGKYLFFSRFGGGIEKYESSSIRSFEDFRRIFNSKNNGLGNIYWISFDAVIDTIKKNENR